MSRYIFEALLQIDRICNRGHKYYYYKLSPNQLYGLMC